VVFPTEVGIVRLGLGMFRSTVWLGLEHLEAHSDWVLEQLEAQSGEESSSFGCYSNVW
jgi:hypothetical protein